MDVTSLLAYAGSSAMQNIGNIEKAVIEILDLRGREPVLKNSIQVVAGGMGGGIPGNPAGGLDGDGVNLKNTFLGDYIQDLAGVGKKQTISDAYFQRLKYKKRSYTVKFNPTSLSFSGRNGGRFSTMDYMSDDNDELQYKGVDATISMSVQLLFDSMDPKDAFMSDKLDFSPTGLLNGAIDAGLSMAGKKKKTIQREVEGFIAALRNENTRLITFNWGDMCYSGVLRRVTTEYTMFNVTGEPVRAMVGLSIMCADAKQWKNSVAVWQERYKNAFEGGSESFVKTSQKMGNLLNI